VLRFGRPTASLRFAPWRLEIIFSAPYSLSNLRGGRNSLRITLILFFALAPMLIAQIVGWVPGESLAQQAKKVASITPRPEITRDQAAQIFALYVDLHIPMKCLPKAFSVVGDCWSMNPSFNDECKSDPEPIRINKKSGQITWRNGPSYESPKALAKAALTLRSSRTPPALPSVPFQHFAISAPLIVSVQAGRG
jgi:hypothetical protein